MEELLERVSERAVRTAKLVETSTHSEVDQRVSLIQLSQPDEMGIVEFLFSPAVKKSYPQAVCWRVDGESMAPRYQDGDFVITSPDQPAAEGHPCVARLKGQIGVNFKVYRTEGNDVVLIPLNETVTTLRFPPSQLLWASRVLYSVRLSENR